MVTTKKTTKTKAPVAKEKATSKQKEFRSKIRKGAGIAKKKIKRDTEIAKVKIEEAAKITDKELKESTKKIKTQIKKKPLASVGAGILAGFALGKLLRFHKKKKK